MRGSGGERTGCAGEGSAESLRSKLWWGVTSVAGEFRGGICFIIVGRSTATARIATIAWCLDLSRQGAEAMRAGRYAEAEHVYRELTKQSPNEAGWHGNLGLALHSQGRYREAIQPLERSLELS